ncbi:hypothetical protein EDB19DRAFT_2024332 [Suillus lakei]|nr:hypothetical protein EDB19DRAFT_2024332 [Suillus lakei]
MRAIAPSLQTSLIPFCTNALFYFFASAASAVPPASAPIHAAMSAVLAILQVIDRCDQNNAVIDGLTFRLYRLYSHLQRPTCPGSSSAIPEKLLSWVNPLWMEVARYLSWPDKIAKTAPLIHIQAIVGCSTDIDHYLAECLVAFYSPEIACIVIVLNENSTRYAGTAGNFTEAESEGSPEGRELLHLISDPLASLEIRLREAYPLNSL